MDSAGLNKFVLGHEFIRFVRNVEAARPHHDALGAVRTEVHQVAGALQPIGLQVRHTVGARRGNGGSYDRMVWISFRRAAGRRWRAS